MLSHQELPELMDVEKNPLHEQLVKAIKTQNCSEVLSLLQNGADPNGPVGDPPLYYAILKFDPNKSSIITSLLQFNADYLTDEFYHLGTQWFSLLDYCINTGIHVDCVMLFLEDMLKKNRLNEINLKNVAIDDKPRILSFLIKNGVSAGANDALMQALNDDVNTRFKSPKNFLNNLKLLYSIVHKEEGLEWNAKLLHNFLQLAIEELDFELAYHLVINHRANLYFKLMSPKQTTIHPLIYLLDDSFVGDEKYRIALFFLMLYKNFNNFEKSITTFVENYNKIRNHSGSLNNRLLQKGSVFNEKLYSATTTFLNPIQQTPLTNLPLALRLKLAIYYLRNELHEEIRLLPNWFLKKLLLNRQADYYYQYYPSRIINHIVKKCLPGLPEPKETSSNALRKLILLYFDKFPVNFTIPECRDFLIKHISSVNYNRLDINTFERIIKNILSMFVIQFNVDKKNANEVLLSAFGLSTAIEQRSTSLFYRFRAQVVAITNNYQDISKLMNIFSPSYPCSIYFDDLSINLKWFNRNLLSYCIDTCNISVVSQVLQQITPRKDDLINAANKNNFHLLHVMLKKIKIFHLDTYLLLFKIAFNFKNRRIITFLFDHFENIDYFVTSLDYSSFLNELCKLLAENKLRSFIPFIHRMRNKLKVSKIPNTPLLQSEIFAIPQIRIGDINQKGLKALTRLLAIKENNNAISKYALGYKFNLMSTFKNNYRDLLNKLAGSVTDEEKPLYYHLAEMRWVGLHKVFKPAALEKIVKEKEILSVNYRKFLGEVIDNQNCPQVLAGYCFLTVGPLQAPIPNFLRNAGGIEFDLIKLLQKYRTLFRNAHVASHWYSFMQNAEYPPINFMGNTIYTFHNNRVQCNRFYHDNKMFADNQNLSQGLFSAKRIIHILSLLFIKSLRAIGGEFYHYILRNHSNDQLIANAFSLVNHPGLLEVLVPHSIPIDQEYCTIKQPPLKKILVEDELIKALYDLEALKEYIKQGFDPEQMSLVQISLEGKPCTYLANFLARAILNRSQPVVEFLLERESDHIWREDSEAINPLSAAILINDTTTALRLMTQGLPVPYLPHTRRLPTKSPLLSKFIHGLPIETIVTLAKRHQNPATYNDLLWSCTKSLLHMGNKSELIEAISILLKLGADPNYQAVTANNQDPYQNYPLIFALKSGCNEVVLELIKKDAKYNYLHINDKSNHHNFFHYLLIQKNYSLIRMLTTLENSSDYFKYSDVLLIFAAGQEELFSEIVTKVFDSDAADSNIETLLNFVIQSFYEDDHGGLEEFIIDLNGKKVDWIDQANLQRLFKAIFNKKQFNHFIRKINSISILDIMMITLDLPTDPYAMIRYVIENEFDLKYELVSGLLECTSELSDDNEIINIFKYLHSIPYYYALALTTINIHNIINYVDPRETIQLFTTTKNHAITENLATFFSKSLTLLSVLRYFLNSPDELLFEKWLLSMVHIEITMASLMDPLIQSPLKALIVTFPNLNSLSSPAGALDIRLKTFLCHLFPNTSIPKLDIPTYFWAKRSRLTNLSCSTNAIDPVTKSLWENFATIKPSLIQPENRQLPKVYCTVSFITCIIQNEPHVYLGRKIYFGAKLKELLAPGGYCGDENRNESLLMGALREITEETKFSIDSMVSDYTKDILEIGEIDLSKSLHHSDNTPHKVSLLYKYNALDSFNSKNQLRERIVYFLWFDFKNDLQHLLSSGDDFADGSWVPLSKIIQNENGEFFYEDQPIASSNGMLINMMKGKLVSRTLLDENLYFESYNRLKFAKGLQKNTFLKTSTSKNLARPNDEIANGPESKKQKFR